MGKNNNINMTKGEKTILSKANDKSYSLRTTVPRGIVNQLGLKEGDSILWVMKPTGNKFTIVVVPHKESK